MDNVVEHMFKNRWHTLIRNSKDWSRKLAKRLFIESSLVRELLAEFFGTVFMMSMGIGCSASNTLSYGKNGDITTQALGWGLTVAFAVTITNGVSGGHLNPCVSFTFSIMGQLPWSKLPFYILCQFLGCFVGSAIAFGIYYDALEAYDGGYRQISGPNATASLFGVYPQDVVSTGTGFATEVFATSILMICVMAINDEKNAKLPFFLGPLFVGLIIVLVNCSYCYNSGCAMNPARDLGPRLFTMIAGWGSGVFSFRSYNWFWVPTVGPMCGAPLGALMYTMFIGYHFSTDRSTRSSVTSSDRRTLSRFDSSNNEKEEPTRYNREFSTTSSKALIICDIDSRQKNSDADTRH